MRTTKLALGMLLTAAMATPAWATPEPVEQPTVLVFSKTAGYRHASIETGIAAIEELGRQNGFRVEATEDSARFTDQELARYGAVVWLSTTGDVLDQPQQDAFERYIRTGGGYVGVHAAADTEYDWPFYGELVGAYFAGHPQIQPATIRVEDHRNDATAHLPNRWERTDEWYNYRANPRPNVHVLASLDEHTYDPGPSAMGGDHPITWCHTVDAGRAFYTGGGHTNESYSEPDFMRHVLGGIRVALGRTPC